MAGVDRRELFFHVAEDLVNAMVMEDRDDNLSAPHYALLKKRVL